MAKNLLKGMAALAICAAFASCSHDTDFESANQEYVVENLKNEYKANFIKKYGEIDPNQSWDFTEISNESVTRGEGDLVPNPTCGTVNLNYKYYSDFISYDAGDVKSKVVTEPIQDWPYTYAHVILVPCYAHGNGNVKVEYSYDVQYSYKGQQYTLGTNVSTQIKGSNWSQASFSGAALNSASAREIDTSSLLYADNATWVVGYRNITSSDPNPPVTYKELKKCKMFTVNKHCYVAFDCDGDGEDFSDLICRVDLAVKAEVEKEKRYLVEDLGSLSDFDFNDIVFDVVTKTNGTQECIVRALGGTRDIEINVGGTSWRKKDHYADFTIMLNTAAYSGETIDYNAVLGRFDVSGWNPYRNNVSVTVYPQKLTNDGIVTIPFPETGEVPMMVAVKTPKTWLTEKTDIRDTNWFEE